MKGANRPRHTLTGDEAVENRTEPRRFRMRIAFMHCKGCAATIEGSLRRISGIREATVDYARGVGSILYDPSKTDPTKILSNPIFQEPSPFEAKILQDQEV